MHRKARPQGKFIALGDAARQAVRGASCTTFDAMQSPMHAICASPSSDLMRGPPNGDGHKARSYAVGERGSVDLGRALLIRSIENCRLDAATTSCKSQRLGTNRTSTPRLNSSAMRSS
jgi:hypothetical protein